MAPFFPAEDWAERSNAESVRGFGLEQLIENIGLAAILCQLLSRGRGLCAGLRPENAGSEGHACDGG